MIMIEISQPTNNQTFSIDDTIIFLGTATADIVRVELWADNQWRLRNSNVIENNSWSGSYSFKQSGQHAIEVRGFDHDNNPIACQIISITIKS